MLTKRERFKVGTRPVHQAKQIAVAEVGAAVVDSHGLVSHSRPQLMGELAERTREHRAYRFRSRGHGSSYLSV